MSNPEITYNRKLVNPSLADLLALHKKDIFLTLNCHGIATIQSFDKDKQTVTATMNYKKSFQQADANGVYSTVLVDYPIMLDMPVIILRGGPANLTFPIQQGDMCLILFNDRDIDNWYQGGPAMAPASGRLHSFSDGIALVGLSSSQTVLTDYDDTRAGLAWGDTVLKVSEDKVKIANTLYTLNGLLQDLITQIKAITVTCATPGNPSSTPINIAAITAVATKIGDLLE